MKKLFPIISVLCLVWSGSAYAEMLKLEKCYNINDSAVRNQFEKKWTEENYLSSIMYVIDKEEENNIYPASRYIDISNRELYTLFKKTEENSFYIKYQDGIVTDYDALTEFFYNYRKSKYEKEYKKPYPDERVTVTDYKITNYTSDKIIAQRTNYFEEGQLKLKLSEWNLIIDLNTNTVDFSINSYNAKQELEKRTNFKYFCQPLNYISQESKGSDKQNTKSNQSGFFKNILGGVLKK
jgi:hypothetical protein